MRVPKISGFSLIELMVAFSIIFITMGLLFPGLYNGKRQAEKIECAHNLKQAAYILNLWAKDHERMPSDFEELVKGGYVDNLSFFRCAVTGKKSDWKFTAAGRKVNELKPNDELIRCNNCNLSVSLDTHVEFLK